MSLVPLSLTLGITVFLQLLDTLAVCENLTQQNNFPKSRYLQSACDPIELPPRDDKLSSIILFREVTLSFLPGLFVKFNMGEPPLEPPLECDSTDE